MSKLSILITGDDGYRSDGIQILEYVLKNDYDLKIAATYNQRSAAGGGLVLGGGKWGTDTINGTEALWTDNTPANSIELAKFYYKKHFDLVISGINYGPNIGSGNTSGTVGAALRSLALGIVDKAIAFSWSLSPDSWTRSHQKDTDLTTEYQYPGKMAKKIIDLAIKNNFWGADFLNINFPQNPGQEMVFTQPIEKELENFYQFSLKLLDDGTYKDADFTQLTPAPSIKNDAEVLSAGKISVVPWLRNLYLNQDLLSLQGKIIKL